MYIKYALLLLTSAWLVTCQRPSFAGTLPIGFPILTNITAADPLGNRFGEDLILPVEAKGDKDLVDRISKLPVDKQPFWYINWKALEEQRKNPQTYPQKPNSFTNAGAMSTANQFSGTNSNTVSNNGSGLTSKFGNENSGGSVSSGSGQTQSNYGHYRNTRRY